MKRTGLIVLLVFFIIPAAYPQAWPPEELVNMEVKLLELKARVVTLDEYAPGKFPDFEELERTNQLVERLDFNKRKFDLLIDQYNLLEDQILPFLLKLSRQSPNLRNQVLAKAREFDGSEEKSILLVQKQINQVALTMERLEKQIERVQLIARAKEVEEGKKQKAKESDQTMSISARIQKLEEERAGYGSEMAAETAKWKTLQEKEKEQQAKIDEKSVEIDTLKKQARETRNPVERQIHRISASVRQIRLNGLEIPRLNTTRTFIYLSKTKIETLTEKIDNIDREVESLKKQRQREIRSQLIRGAIVVVVAIFLVLLLINIFKRIGSRVIKKLEESTHIDTHRKQRYQTLFSVILSITKIILWILAVLWVLGELSIDYAPFLVAAGGLSLAIGFGAQSLVKDFFSGFFMLMEEQLALGDVVDIDGKTGTVEKISFRTLRLRGLDGTVHIIPNGNISSVSNLTHQWSRAVTNVGVSYDADPARVLAVLQELCTNIYKDPQWQAKLLEEPVPQGIVSFGDSAVNFRILAKTAPGEQWAVDRELHIRVKRAFDENGIEIPYNFVNIIDRTEKQKQT